MAFRMQSSVPELSDMSGEPQHILDMYGVKQPGDGSFASNCLLARRMLERGVRFVQLYHRGWDHHGRIEKNMPTRREAHRPGVRRARQGPETARLVRRHARHLGRRVRAHADGPGRPAATTTSRASASGWPVPASSPASTYGATDELGYASVQDIVHVRDLHATLLHQFGIDHARFSTKFQGLDYQLTGVEPCRVLKPILA